MSTFNTSRKLRKKFIALLSSLSLEELNYVPEGFNNNIIWNFGHCIVTHQQLCYSLSGVTPPIDAKWINLFKKGTAPHRDFTQEEVDELKVLALQLLEKLDADKVEGIFKKYNKYVSALGVTITNISEAIVFNNVHEGVHIGYAMSMKHVIEYQKRQWQAEEQTRQMAIAQ
ncbi:DinB family protein [Flammeovirga yaeyamensis]|uniref:DinB family protein n=1 Tax=Flammeovirga yaeyamensis TaxID=367791 RepID=A0AAX1N651_9BACT|nr:MULTISPECIES: DinB family protein [Flammeovirga]ANQ49661.1 DinB family protein [Flammeovirga sp. MY04]MBB3697480.1 hypothetical protein [Flammeovirga yaeyamensis]NMF36174.1 DinB family protein [Flammeovirga yaeyamensis]QWG02907.1 DinB family protein [Flammeovirga yaeyamensis]